MKKGMILYQQFSFRLKHLPNSTFFECYSSTEKLLPLVFDYSKTTALAAIILSGVPYNIHILGRRFGYFLSELQNEMSHNRSAFIIGLNLLPNSQQPLI